MHDPATLPWWAQPGAAVDKARIENTGTDCPICELTDRREWIDLYFAPGPGELRLPLIGSGACAHIVAYQFLDPKRFELREILTHALVIA